MPYSGVPSDQTDKLDACVQKVMKGGQDKSAAIAICRKQMNMSEDVTECDRLTFEPFSSLAGVLAGAPFKIMPVGTFYRDNRKLTITPARLQEFAANVRAGLPRFRIPINENHGGVGKVGTVEDIAYLADGPDGEGLYATKYKLTEKGRELVTSKRFDAVSPEAVWTLNDGAQYQDPTTGNKHDNVLVGLALTDKPFFGHDHVALFSATQPEQFRHNGYTKLKAKLHELLGLIDETELEPPAEPAAVPAAPAAQGVTTMADEVKPTPPAATEPEKFAVSAEEFKALQAKAGEVDKMAAMLGEMKRARRVDQITAHAKETFAYLPVSAEDLAEKFAALEDHDAKLYEYFDGLLATMDKQIAAGNLFSQVGTALTGSVPDTFDALVETILAEKFSGDHAHYAEAMGIARKKNPALFAEYSKTYSAPRPKPV